MTELTLLDGGFGTMIQAAGLGPGEDPTDWNLSHPEAVTAVHRAYVAAGSSIVLANTFGANRLKYRGTNDLGELIRAALANARAAGAPKVALDIGPTGRLLKPAGDLDFETAYEAFAEMVREGEGQRSKVKGQRSKVKGQTEDIDQFHCLTSDLGPLTSSLTSDLGPLTSSLTSDLGPLTSSLTSDLGPLTSVVPDLIFIETMGDTMELKAAVLAAKENSNMPVWATVALGTDGKLLTGGSVECVAELLEGLGVDAYGFNCGLGPDLMLPYVRRLAAVTTKPIIVKPNAGLPRLVDGQTVFDVGPEAFAGHVARLVDAGATIVGGCCGTTPDHIASLASHVSRHSLASHVSCLSPSCEDTRRETRDAKALAARSDATRVSSGTSVVSLSPHAGIVIGERINPTGKRLLKEALKNGDVAYVLREAVKQVDAGAAILDINCGVPGIDEAATMDRVLAAVQSVATCPIQIDTADPKALEVALRHVNGKPLVNSVNGKRESMDAVFPLVKRHGGTIVALCLDETGIPPTAEGRLAIARRILAEGAKYGFRKSDFVFDALTLAVSADANAATVTLETVKRLTEELGVNTVLGVSNVSFGLPNRSALNNAMYALAKRAGLSAAIANPSLIRDEIVPEAEDVLLGRDPGCARWIAEQGGEKKVGGESRATGGEKVGQESRSTADGLSACGAQGLRALPDAIRHGLKDDARAAAQSLLTAPGQRTSSSVDVSTPGQRTSSSVDVVTPGQRTSSSVALEVIEKGIVPALEEVGRGFEQGTVYLPQLLMAADAAGAAFEVVRAAMSRVSRLASRDLAEDARQETRDARPLILATVKGDIHDIGKNIVRALLENYGFSVIDLGRDVPPETIVETARKTGARLIGLSALMTTTVGAMAETIRQVRAAGLEAKVVVGGAVVTQEFADEIGADYYAKDAMRTVRIAESLRAV